MFKQLHRESGLLTSLRQKASGKNVYKSKSKFGTRKRQKGTAIIEFSIVALAFLLTLFTILDVAVIGYVKLTMQHAVREGARYAITGRTDLDPDGNASREAAIMHVISEASNGYFDKVTGVDEMRVEDMEGNNVIGFGGSGDMIAIHIDCEWDIISPFMYAISDDGKYNFTVSAAMRNEAF